MSGVHVWTEHRNAEGRTYWYHTGTKQSVWEKPADLKTPFERALGETPWKEYFSGGRKYYYHTETKESKWDMPDELLLLLEKVEKDAKAQSITLQPPITRPAPAFTPASTGPVFPQGATQPSLPALNSSGASQPVMGLNSTNGALVGTGSNAPLNTTGGPGVPRPQSSIPGRPGLPDDPVIPHNGWATHEEAEKAFNHLLRKAGVDATWTWEQTMRAIITDPLYKSFNSLAERKAAWQNFTENLKQKEQEERDARLSRLRPAIRNMLRGNPNVFHFSTFPQANKLFAAHPIWQMAKIEAERRMIFEEYVAELKQKELTEAREQRVRSMEQIVQLFKRLDIDVVTRWRHAHRMILDSEEYKFNPQLQKLPALDMLLAFEDYSRVLDREYQDTKHRNNLEKKKTERKAREGFKDLLNELVSMGKIAARTKWKAVYAIFANDPRFLNMLGNPGSNPLELFWDVVDKLDQALDVKVSVVEGVLTKKMFVFGFDTTWEHYASALEGESIGDLTPADLRECFEFLREQQLRIQSEERKRIERKLRRAQDDLRYALKKIAPSIDLNGSYEDALPSMQDLAEYKAVDDEHARRTAFTKFVKRQKEKLQEMSEDAASNNSRKKRDSHRDERGHDKEHRDGEDHDREKREQRDSKREDHGGRDHEKEYHSRDFERDHHRRDHARDRRSSRDYERPRPDRDFEMADASRHSHHVPIPDGYAAEDPAYGAHYSREREHKDHERDYNSRSKRDSRDDKRTSRRPRDVELWEGFGGNHHEAEDYRPEKRARTDQPETAAPPPASAEARAESPEEGEI